MIALLQKKLPAGWTALAEMLERARAPSWRFKAIGAAFEVKERLRLRGYRWHAVAKSWWREVPDTQRVEEEWWLSPAILARACDATEVKAVEHWHGSKLVLRVRQSDVDAFAKVYHASLPLDTVGARLGVHPTSVMQLVAAGILPARGPRPLGEGPRVMRTDLEMFETSLIGAQRQTVDNPVPLYRAIFAVGARPKPWAAMIAAMLNGDLPFNIRSRETGGYDTRARFGSTPIYQAVIPADMVARIAEMPDGTDADWWSPPTTLTKLEACEILNLTPNTDALDGVSKTDEFFSRLNRSEVMALAQRAIGVGEIAFRCGWKAGFGHKLLRELGVPSLFHSLWCRATVETMLTAGRF